MCVLESTTQVSLLPAWILGNWPIEVAWSVLHKLNLCFVGFAYSDLYVSIYIYRHVYKYHAFISLRLFDILTRGKAPGATTMTEGNTDL